MHYSPFYQRHPLSFCANTNTRSGSTLIKGSVDRWVLAGRFVQTKKKKFELPSGAFPKQNLWSTLLRSLKWYKRCQEEEEEFGNAEEEFLADLRFDYDIYTPFPLCTPHAGPFMHWMRVHQRREQMVGVGDHFLSTCQGKGTIESWLAYAFFMHVICCSWIVK